LPKPSDLLQGTLDLLVLRTIAREPLHGWGIAKRIQALSGDVLSVGQGSLYPALHRLEREGWIKSEWTISGYNQRVKEYRLTAAGKKQLLSERSQWNQMAAAIAAIVGPVSTGE
jgi:transcriptional regulator